MDTLLTIPEFCKIAGGICKSHFYKLKNAGLIKTVSIGRRTFIRSSDAAAYIAGLSEA